MSKRRYFPRAGRQPVKETVYTSINLELLTALLDLVPLPDRQEHAYLLAKKMRDEAADDWAALDKRIERHARKVYRAIEKARAKMTPEARDKADAAAARILRG